MDLPSVMTALAGAVAFLALAVATFAALRAEQAHRAARANARSAPCARVHASEVAEAWLARERADCVSDEPPIGDLDLPAWRGPTTPVVDEDEVNPRIGLGAPRR